MPARHRYPQRRYPQMLTEKELKNAKPRDKPYKLAAGGGLHLLIKPSGSRLWRLKYRVDGREKLLSFGMYPEVSLKLARERRDEARLAIRKASTQERNGNLKKPQSRRRLRQSRASGL
jgi:hypothetical protein